MRAFRFFPPSLEEQRAFFVQLGGTILSCAVVGVLAWRADTAELRAAMIGAGLGVLFLLGRHAWQLERKAARAQHGEIVVEERGFSHTDFKGRTDFVAWDQIETLEVRGGRLQLTWRDEARRQRALCLGAREMENGMELIQLIAGRGRSTPAAPPSNFIPLEPK